MGAKENKIGLLWATSTATAAEAACVKPLDLPRSREECGLGVGAIERVLTQFSAVAPAGGPPLVGGRPGGGHPECLHGCAIERQAIEQLGEVRFRAATTH